MSDSRSILEKMKDELIPSAIAGGIGIIAANQLMGVDLSTKINIFNFSLPAWGVIGGSIFASNSLSYGLHDMVLEKIPSIQSIATYENKLLAPALSAVFTYLALREGVSTDVSLINSALLGAGSTIGAQYAYDIYKNK